MTEPTGKWFDATCPDGDENHWWISLGFNVEDAIMLDVYVGQDGWAEEIEVDLEGDCPGATFARNGRVAHLFESEAVLPMNLSQPICEKCWVERNATFNPDGSASIRMPVRLTDPCIERCAFCGHPTIFGAYIRKDPREVPFPAEGDDG